MKDLTKGKPSALILSFAIPVFLGNLLQLTYRCVRAGDGNFLRPECRSRKAGPCAQRDRPCDHVYLHLVSMYGCFKLYHWKTACVPGDRKPE